MENNKNLTRTFKTHLKGKQIRENYSQASQLNVKGSRVIHHLGFEYYMCSMDLEPINSNRFLKPLEKFKLIQDLTVCLYQPTRKEIISKDFSEKLRSLSSLQTLNLQFGSADWLFPGGMVHLANALGDLKRLSKLTLNFNTCI